MSWCWITGHKWKIISFYNYIDRSWCNEDDAGAKSNTVTLQCQKCGNTKTKSHWCGGFIVDPRDD